LALGCDVLVGGISGLGPEKLDQIIKSAQDESGTPLSADNLLKILSKRTGCDLSFQELKVLLDAWYFEPAAVTESGDFQYVFEAPPGPVDEYCGAFAEKSEPGFQLIECHGHVGQHPHKYLQSLAVSCSECDSLCCGFCCIGYSPLKCLNKYQKWTCLRCHASEIPADDVTTEKMREEILAAGLRVPQEATVAELQGLYQEAIENQAFHVPHETRYPLLQSKSITDGTLEHITNFNFEDGGQMVHDPLLKADKLVELTTLLSKMVTFSDVYLRDDMSPTHRKATEALPDIVNKFCGGSRADHGERLKKRALRHALDPKSPPLDCGGHGALVRYNDQIGLLISQTMSPSYHQDVDYRPIVVFTSEDLLAASDDSDCKAGPTNECRHICVHILPLLVELTLLLFDGLAEHLLVELAAQWHKADDNALCEEQRESMIASLENLATAFLKEWVS